mmetsp:Transcript_14846/g.34454  ORF Transcript_14846/g.34454 Transcript_14846/m.34454 type:complete len:289 (+) Transcript_14846:1483-2349(+)
MNSPSSFEIGGAVTTLGFGTLNGGVRGGGSERRAASGAAVLPARPGAEAPSAGGVRGGATADRFLFRCARSAARLVIVRGAAGVNSGALARRGTVGAAFAGKNDRALASRAVGCVVSAALFRPRVCAGTKASASACSVEHCTGDSSIASPARGRACASAAGAEGALPSSSSAASAAKRLGGGSCACAREFGGDRGVSVVSNGKLLPTLQQLLSSPPPTSHPLRPPRPPPPRPPRPPPPRLLRPPRRLRGAGGVKPRVVYSSGVSLRKLLAGLSIQGTSPPSASYSARV